MREGWRVQKAFRNRNAIEAVGALHTSCTEKRSMKRRDLAHGISHHAFDARTRNLGQFSCMSECIEQVGLAHAFSDRSDRKSSALSTLVFSSSSTSPRGVNSSVVTSPLPKQIANGVSCTLERSK